MTAPIPDDDVELEALKQQVAPDYATHGWEVHIHRVPYDFGQLWRWKVILDRFALSAANTVGIVDGQEYRSVSSPLIYRKSSRQGLLRWSRNARSVSTANTMAFGSLAALPRRSC